VRKLLDLKGIYVRGNGDEYRLRNIHLSINSGERIALLGQSGAGKSTLLEVANGSLQPHSGHIKWRGIHLKHLTPKQRQRIATLWQDLRLIEELTVVQNINVGALGQHNLLWAFRNLLGTIESKECLPYIEAAGLEQKNISTPVQKLSGGQRQRVAIARLLRQQAELLLADEPLSSLDPTLAGEVLELFLNKKAIQSIGIPETCMISLHRPDLISNFTRVIGLKQGQIAFDCPVHNLLPFDINMLYIDE